MGAGAATSVVDVLGLCPGGGIGRHASLRGWCLLKGVQVRLLSWALRGGCSSVYSGLCPLAAYRWGQGLLRIAQRAACLVAPLLPFDRC